MPFDEAAIAANRAQADVNACEWYKYLVVTGTGKFVDIMKQCEDDKNYTNIDNAIREHITPYLYNDGEGKMVPCSEIDHVRNCFRTGNKVKPPPSESERISSRSPLEKGYTGAKVKPFPDVEADSTVKEKQMKLVCWDLYRRGAVGESLIHTCLLIASPLVISLAKRLLSIFPKLLVDIYLSDQYFGENILHLAIAKENPDMVGFLLDLDTTGLITKERAFGTFFSGDLSCGEYPLSFAASLGQEECLRLLLSTLKKSDPLARVDPKAQDHNGNTVLHMLVIHNKLEMFDLVLSMAPSGPESHPDLLSIKNNEGLTPLTLAAAMAHKEMYNHLIEKEREVYWVYGDVTCAAYPLDNIDTIGPDGEINPTSALHLIIYGNTHGHLEMVDGMVVTLLEDKWTTFLRGRFYWRMLFFIAYFVVFLIAFALRPGVIKTVELDNGTSIDTNTTRGHHNCYLIGPPAGEMYSTEDYARLTLEGITLIGVVIYLLSAALNLKHTGIYGFLKMLLVGSQPKSVPSLAMFYLSCICVLLMVPGRALCSLGPELAVYEEYLAIIMSLMAAPHFLFYFRAIKPVGPFVTMIYRMLIEDLPRFFGIYLTFLFGFSQSMYIVHFNYNHPDNKTTPFRSAPLAFMGMFYMSMGEFSVMYEDLKYTSHEVMGKVIFVLYMVLVTLLLINVLIAMMGKTYTQVNETQKEWLRQWAYIVLAIEQTVSPEERLRQQKRYSQPMENNNRALVIRWHQTEKEKENLL